MRFRVQERPVDWVASAPIRIEYKIPLAAPPEEVFALLGDHETWTTWFVGMSRVRIDGASSGVGALRTVWVGAARVQEHFVVWEPDRRLVLYVVESNLPGLRVMVEDWRLARAATGGTLLSVTIGVEGAGIMRAVPWLVRAIVGRSTRGAAGIARVFG